MTLKPHQIGPLILPELRLLCPLQEMFLLPGIREQNVTFVLTVVLWEFSQLVLDPSSGRTFFLVRCLRNIVRLFGNLEWQTAGHYGEEVDIICDMCCGGKCLEQES